MNKSKWPRSIADAENGVILSSVEIDAPPERVFRALTSPDEVPRWWGSDDTYRTTSWTGDLRPGGAWQAEGKSAGGEVFSVGGTYLEVDPPRKLVHTWRAYWDGGCETQVTFLLEPIPSGTLLTLRHEGFAGRPDSCKAHAAGWERVFGWLIGYVAPITASQYYFCRLLPPRPSFAQDASGEERAIMRKHFEYWNGHLEAGSVVVFGPVADPSGAWGAGIVRMPDSSAIQEFEKNDPAMQAGIGFRYESLPMIRAVV